MSQTVMERIATVGSFDGCHRGHQIVLQTLRDEARRRGLEPLVITFSNHPLQIVDPSRAPGALQRPEEKRRMIEESGLPCEMMEFTPDLCSLTAAEWISRLRDSMGVKAILLGYDNTFGSDGRRMSHNDYVTLGSKLGIDVLTAPEVEGCSSSAVRKALAAGNVEKAAEILGRYYSLGGIVTRGDRIGSSIGIPTANIAPDKGMVIPADGVYATIARLPDGSRHTAVTDIGHRPTVSDTFSHSLRIETHIPGWSGDLYGRRLEILFVARLRDEMRFSGLDELRRVIGSDITRAKEITTE